jgi:hypothetical protein
MIIDYHKDKIHETIKSMQQYRNQTPFLNRDKFKTQSYSIYQSCKDAYKQNIKEGIPKQRITIGNIMGGAGQGKTRACLELVNILKEKYEDDIILSVRFEFYNGSMLRGFENTNSASSIFGLRILLAFLGYLHISQFGEYTTSNLGISIEQLFYSEIFSINSVFAKISPILHDYFKTNKSKTIYLIVIADEYNQLYKAFKDKWKLPLYSLLEYVITEQEKNSRLDRDRLCIIPFISGTYSQFESQKIFDSSGYCMKLLSLPPFKWETVKQLIKIKFGNQSTILLSNEEMKKFFYEASIVPRILIDEAFRYMENKLNKKEIQREEDITDDFILKMRREVYERYKNLGNTIKQHKEDVVNIIFSGLDMSLFNIGSWLDEAILFGAIYRGYKGKLYTHSHIFFKLLKSVYPSLADKMAVLRKNFTWEAFEWAQLYTFFNRLKTYIMGKCSSIAIKDLIPGHMDENLGAIKINLPAHIEGVTEDERSWFSNKNFYNGFPDDWFNSNKIWKSAKGCPMLDGFWCTTLESNSSSKIIFLFQYGMSEDGGVTVSYKNPVDWMTKLSGALNNFKSVESVKLVYVLITNSSLSKKHYPPNVKVAKKAIHVIDPKELIVICANNFYKMNPINLTLYYEPVEAIGHIIMSDSQQSTLINENEIFKDLKQKKTKEKERREEPRNRL